MQPVGSRGFARNITAGVSGRKISAGSLAKVAHDYAKVAPAIVARPAILDASRSRLDGIAYGGRLFAQQHSQHERRRIFRKATQRFASRRPLRWLRVVVIRPALLIIAHDDSSFVTPWNNASADLTWQAVRRHASRRNGYASIRRHNREIDRASWAQAKGPPSHADVPIHQGEVIPEVGPTCQIGRPLRPY